MYVPEAIPALIDCMATMSHHDTEIYFAYGRNRCAPSSALVCAVLRVHACACVCVCVGTTYSRAIVRLFVHHQLCRSRVL
jgi:hypothetical protein